MSVGIEKSLKSARDLAKACWKEKFAIGHQFFDLHTAQVKPASFAPVSVKPIFFGADLATGDAAELMEPLNSSKLRRRTLILGHLGDDGHRLQGGNASFESEPKPRHFDLRFRCYVKTWRGARNELAVLRRLDGQLGLEAGV